MASREQIERKTESLLKPIMDEHHFELVDVEYVKEVIIGTCGHTSTKKAVLTLMTVNS